VLKYSLWRLALFAVCFAIAWGAFAITTPDRSVGEDQTLYALLIGALGSMVLSWFFLKRMRQDISDRINERVAAHAEAKAADAAGTGPDRRSEDELAEDAEADRG